MGFLFSRPFFLRLTIPVFSVVAIVAATFGVLHLRSASPVVDRSAIQTATVESGPIVFQVEGLGTLVPEDVRWLAAGTDGHVDQVYLRPGAHVKPDTIILQLSNPDLERQLTDADLAMKKSEAELANLRVQLQAQLLNERALEAQLEADATEARLQAERDESLYKMQVGASMNAKISRARADSLATRLQIEREKLGIAEEAREAQLTAKQAEVSQMHALYDLRMGQKDALQVRAGMEGVLEEVSVGNGQQVGPGTNLARVTNSARLMARIHVPENQANQIELNQKAEISVQDQLYPAHVVRIDPNVQNGTVSIDLKFAGAQPRGARTELTAGGRIEIDREPSATFIQSHLQSHNGDAISLYRISPDGKQARRVPVHLGRASKDSVQVLDGLQPGDRVIVSDMSTWHRYDTLQLK